MIATKERSSTRITYNDSVNFLTGLLRAVGVENVCLLFCNVKQKERWIYLTLSVVMRFCLIADIPLATGMPPEEVQ